MQKLWTCSFSGLLPSKFRYIPCGTDNLNVPSYGTGARLGGVIYLHDISQPRILHSYGKFFELFSSLSEEEIVGSIVLATTKWSEVKSKEMGLAREKALQSKFWAAEMIRQGAQPHRFNDSSDSAWELVRNLLREERVLEMVHSSRNNKPKRSFWVRIKESVFGT